MMLLSSANEIRKSVAAAFFLVSMVPALRTLTFEVAASKNITSSLLLLFIEVEHESDSYS